MENIPKKIYLQVDADGERPCDFNECHEITWSSTKINSTDLEFVLNEEVLAEEKNCANCKYGKPFILTEPCLSCCNTSQWKSNS